MTSSSQPSQKSSILAMIFVTLAVLFWAGNIYVSKVTSGHIPPILMNVMRWIGAGLLLTPFAIKPVRNDWPVIRKSLPILCFFSFLSVSLYNALLYLSAHTTSAINIAVISTLMPLCTFIFSWLLYRIKPTNFQLLGFTLGILGVLVLVFQGQWTRLLGVEFTVGDIWIFIAVVAWALYSATLPSNRPKISGVSFLYCTIILGVLIALPAVGWEYSRGARWIVGPSDKWLLAYICLIPSLLAYLCYNYAIATLGAIKTVMFSYFMPIFTAIISIVWLKESIAPYHVAGQVLIIIGFYFSVLK